NGERWKHLLSGQEAPQPPSHLRERERVTLKEPPEGEEGEGPTEELVLLSERSGATDSPEHARFVETLSCHSERVTAHAERIASALNLPKELGEAVVLAARWHDRGKDRPVWQRYAQNRNGNEPLAKSDKYGHGRELGGYRHEFGSLLQAAADREILNHPERDLILHLIAAHHGWARPHFEPQARDNEGPVDPATGQRRRPTTRQNEAVAIEAMQRFGRLQLRFGRWGLAWLESLLRCADALASQTPNQADAPVNTAANAGGSGCVGASQSSSGEIGK
ncbi:MAG TPA: CRISPR-associated endonuclease Cas3'', partial [Tepidisphaeraceae bacterium]|nr:CRISPR-associated endonuclease Cas3'' [Tepidisphaeraceae bacterium]